MILLTDVFLLGVLSAVVYQDLKERALYIIILGFFALAVLARTFLSPGFQFSGVLLNSGFLGLQIIVLTVYFSLKNKKLTGIADNYLGKGDLLFLFILCFYFSPAWYIVFLISGFLFSLIVHLLQVNIFRPAKKEIPLAGYMGAFLMILLLLSFVYPALDFYDDSIILEYLAVY